MEEGKQPWKDNRLPRLLGQYQGSGVKLNGWTSLFHEAPTAEMPQYFLVTEGGQEGYEGGVSREVEGQKCMSQQSTIHSYKDEGRE